MNDDLGLLPRYARAFIRSVRRELASSDGSGMTGLAEMVREASQIPAREWEDREDEIRATLHAAIFRALRSFAEP